MKQIKRNIWFNAENSNDNFEPGWYFSDEVEQLEGPYKSQEEAEREFNEYVRWNL